MEKVLRWARPNIDVSKARNRMDTLWSLYPRDKLSIGMALESKGWAGGVVQWRYQILAAYDRTGVEVVPF